MCGSVIDWRVTDDVVGSDHKSITFSINIDRFNKGNSENRYVSSKNKIDQTKYNYKKTDWERFKRILEARLAEEVNEDVIMTAIDESTPRMKERKRGWKKQVTWWNDELAGMRREVVAAKKQLVRRRKWSCLVEAEKRYLAEVRTSYVKAIKSAKECSWKDFLERYGVDEGGPANPWGTLHRQAAGKTKKVSFGSLERDDGSWTTSWKESAELLLERFFSSDEEDACDGSHQHIRELVKSYQNCNVESPVTREEIIRCLKRSKNSKAPGPDGVLYEHLKVVQEICPDSSAGFLNKYLYNRTYPVNWKVAKLAVIPKGKRASLTKAGSYRPISLLSAMGKLYERILVSRVEQDYDARGLNSSSQFGSKRLCLLKTPYARSLGPSKIKIKSLYYYYLLIFKAPLITYGGLQFYYV